MHIFGVNFIVCHFELSSISVGESFAPNGRCVGHWIGEGNDTMVSNRFPLDRTDESE